MYKYRVWHIPQVPGKAFEVEVDDFRTAVFLSEVLFYYDLFQFDNNIKPDYASAGWIQARDDEGWHDLDDYEINELLKENNA